MSREKQANESKSKKPVQKSTLDLLPFVCIDKGIFYMRDKSYMDIFQITTKDLIAAPDSDVEFDMLQFEKFYKMYAADCKIIGINFPTDTAPQQQYYQHLIGRTENPVFRDYLQQKYEELVDINLNFTDREYYLMIFAPTYEKYIEAKNIIKVTLEYTGLLKETDVDRKIKIITKLCNKSTSIYG